MSGAKVSSKKRKMDNGDGLCRESSPDFFHLLRTMLKNKKYTDVTIKVGSGIKSEEIECHSLILIAHSPVLSAMLNSRWNEGGNERIITLEDDDAEHFLYFVDLMYSDWREEDHKYYDCIPYIGSFTKTAVGVLSLAHKYLASNVILQVEYWLFCCLNNGSPADAVEIYTKLKSLQICQVEDKARSLLRTVENWVLAELFFSDAILLFNQSDLMTIVGKHYLQCSELSVYNGCIKWGQEQCKLNQLPLTGENVRSVLGDKIIKSIRFPLLDRLTITKTVRPAKILTSEELNELFTYIIQKDLLSEKENPIGLFSSEPRTKNELLRVNRLEEDFEPNQLADFSTAHGFVMTTSENLNLCALKFYGGPSTSGNYTFQVEIGDQIFRKEVKGYANKKKVPIISVEIVPNILFKSGKPITIKFTITGGCTYICPYTVQDLTKEITYWGTEAVISKFHLDRQFPNGLTQIPSMIFSPADADSDSDSSDSN